MISKTLFTCLMVLPLGILIMAPLDVLARPINGDAPIDGGLSLLVAAGIAYGGRKIYNKRKKEEAHMEKK